MKFELNKLLSNRILLLGLVISCIYTIYYSYTCYIERRQYGEDVMMDEIYEKCLGDYSNEKSELITKQMEEAMFNMETNPEDTNLLNIFQAYQDLYSKANICEQMYTYRSTVVKNAARLKKSEDAYIARLNAKIEKMYSKSPKIKITDGTKAKDITDILTVTDNIDMINIILLVIAACTLFIIEHKNNTYSLVYSSYGGRKKTYLRKVACMIGFAVFLSIITSISLVLLTFTYGKMEEWKQAVQGLEMFMYSPYNLNVAGLLLVVTLLRAFGYITLIMIFTVISIGFKSNIIPLLTGTLLGVGGFGISAYFSDNSVKQAGTILKQQKLYMLFRKYTPYALIGDGEGYLVKYEPVNILGYPFSVISIGVVVNIAIIIVTLIVGYQLYLKRYRKCGV